MIFLRTINHTALALTIFIVISGSFGALGASRYSHGSKRSVRLNNYNNWELGSTSDTPAVLQSRLMLLAKRDYIMFGEGMEWPNDVSGWDKLSPSSLKSLNPNIKIYRYFGFMSKNPNDSDWNGGKGHRVWCPFTRKTIDANDWWLRDGDGNIVKESGGLQWYLDVGKPGYKEAYLKAMLERVSGKGFDGFVFDYWQPRIFNSFFAVPGGWFKSHRAPKAYSSDEDWFKKAWQPFIKYVCEGARKGGYKVIGNCAGQYGTSDAMQQWNRTQVDGVVYEQGAVGWQGEWLPGSWMEERINAIANDPLEVWVADGGLSLNNTGSEYERKRTVSLAMYYVAVPQSQAKRSYHHKYDGKVFWDSLWDFYIGEPAEAMVKQQGAYFWSRKYSQGMVLLNYENSRSISYTLDGKYKDMSGKEYSGTVTLPAHTALILAKS